MELSLVKFLTESINGDKIKQAIENGDAIEFFYKNIDGTPDDKYHKRFIEPFTLGHHIETGNEVVAGWHVGGWSKRRRVPEWRLYRTDMMKNIRIVKRKKRVVRPGYNPPDSRMGSVTSDMSMFFTPSKKRNKFNKGKQAPIKKTNVVKDDETTEIS